MMHPVIRLACLLVFAAFVPWLPPRSLLVFGALMVALTVWRPATARVAWQGLRRMRWLLLSIAVLYLWFYPGEPLVPALAGLSPSREGAVVALHRAGVLAVMVWSAAFVLAATPPREVTAALRQLLAGPLRSAVTLRFADRVGLLLAELPAIQQRVGASLRQGEGSFADRAARLVRGIEAQADDDRLQPEPPLDLGPVPALHGLLPFALAAGGILIIVYG